MISETLCMDWSTVDIEMDLPFLIKSIIKEFAIMLECHSSLYFLLLVIFSALHIFYMSI